MPLGPRRPCRGAGADVGGGLLHHEPHVEGRAARRRRPVKGVTLVSSITSAPSSGTDSSSAAIRQHRMGPWPCSTALVITSTLPSLFSLTKPNDAVGVRSIEDAGQPPAAARARRRRPLQRRLVADGADLAPGLAHPDPVHALARHADVTLAQEVLAPERKRASELARHPVHPARPPTTPAGCRGRGSRRRAADWCRRGSRRCARGIR